VRSLPGLGLEKRPDCNKITVWQLESTLESRLALANIKTNQPSNLGWVSTLGFREWVVHTDHGDDEHDEEGIAHQKERRCEGGKDLLGRLQTPEEADNAESTQNADGKVEGAENKCDMETTKASKTDQLFDANSRNQWQKRLSRSSKVKTIVNPIFAKSKTCLIDDVDLSAWKSWFVCNCA
jgi:hypothetical protein